MKRIEPFAFVRDLATRWDLVALVVVLGLLAFLTEAAHGLFAPLSILDRVPISLDPRNLPFYAARTTLRMFAAMALSLLFTFTYATWAAKSARAEKLLVPILDILQSVPILGFISVTIPFFMALAPGRVLGAEFAAIFGIFTSQAWNMAFSFYQSLRTIPTELVEAADSFHLSPWMRFWRLEVPFAMPGLLWNILMSMSGSWFFVVASETLSVGHTNIALPGVGSYIAVAVAQDSTRAIVWAIVAMALVILAYDQLIFRPLVVWGDRFRIDQEQTDRVPESWALTMMKRSRLFSGLRNVFFGSVLWVNGRFERPTVEIAPRSATSSKRLDSLWFGVLVFVVALSLWSIAHKLFEHTSAHEVVSVAGLALLTLLRVVVLIALASVIWVPIGVWVGLHPRVTSIVQPTAQFLAAFPTTLLFPVFMALILSHHLNPDIWLSPLLILGTQWYILFNVIAGASALPTELRYAAENFGVRGWLWWRRVAIPGGTALLRHRGDHGVGRRLECLGGGRGHLRRGQDRARTRSGRLHYRCLDRRRLPSIVARHDNHEPVRGGGESPVLAPLVLLCGTQIPAELAQIFMNVPAALATAELLQVRDVRKSFPKPDGGELVVLDGVNLTMVAGQIVGLLGRSGSGKSTLLRLIAGLSEPTAGTLTYRGKPVDGPTAGVAMVFQSFALFPWLTVFENVALGLEAQRMPKADIRKRSLAAIDLIGLDGFESAYPRELSGGMRQRVGLCARAGGASGYPADGRTVLGARCADRRDPAHRFPGSVGRRPHADQGRHPRDAQYRGGGAHVRPHPGVRQQPGPHPD